MSYACAFCGAPAVFPCSWIGPKIVPQPVFELLHGERVFSFLNRSVWGRVTKIESHEGRARVTLEGQYSGVRVVKWDSLVNVERTAPCDKPCCERHARDLGDDEHYICAGHWAAQREAVA